MVCPKCDLVLKPVTQNEGVYSCASCREFFTIEYLEARLEATDTEPYAIKICVECHGDMGLYEYPGPDLVPDLEWACHDCGVTESYSEWCARTRKEVKFF